MYVDSSKGVVKIRFTLDEEYEFAKFIMDLLSNIAVSGDLYELCHDCYMEKTKDGYNITGENLLRIFDLTERLHINVEAPTFEMDQKAEDGSMLTKGKSYKAMWEEYKFQVIRAWREIWEEHEALHKCAFEFKTFPGDEALKKRFTELELKSFYNEEEELAKEQRYWDTVDMFVKEEGHKRSEARILAADICPRGRNKDGSFIE